MTETTVTNELIFEVLKKIQGDVSHTRNRTDDLEQQFVSIGKQIVLLLREVVLIREDLVRIEGATLTRLTRIERRLDLEDAPA